MTEPMTPTTRPATMLLRINPIACDGHGLCAELLPELLALDDWGYPYPMTVAVPPSFEGLAGRAVKVCPTLAIQLERLRPEASA
jgi:ferredoxin